MIKPWLHGGGALAFVDHLSIFICGRLNYYNCSAEFHFSDGVPPVGFLAVLHECFGVHLIDLRVRQRLDLVLWNASADRIELLLTILHAVQPDVDGLVQLLDAAADELMELVFEFNLHVEQVVFIDREHLRVLVTIRQDSKLTPQAEYLLEDLMLLLLGGELLRVVVLALVVVRVRVFGALDMVKAQGLQYIA